MHASDRVIELLSKVPCPPEEGIPVGVLDSEFDLFTQRTGVEVPAELKEWLRISNGPCVGPGGLYGIRTSRTSLDIEQQWDIYPAWKNRGWIPIADDGCGNDYVMPTKREFGDGYPIVFVEPSLSSDVPAYIVASGLGHFLHFLLEKEYVREILNQSDPVSWPFNKPEVVKRDPRILEFRGVPLPWDA